MYSPYRFLIVDDSSDMLFLLQEKIFRHFRTAITLAKSGNDAVSLIKNGFTFDLIICDFHMPDGNGLVVFDHLKILENPPLFILYTSADNLPIFHGKNFLGIVSKDRQQDIIKIAQMHFCKISA